MRLVWYYNNNNNNNNNNCGSHFRWVWGDPAVGNVTSTGIPIHIEVDFKRPTKRFCEKVLKRKALAKHLKREISAKEAETERS